MTNDRGDRDGLALAGRALFDKCVRDAEQVANSAHLPEALLLLREAARHLKREDAADSQRGRWGTRHQHQYDLPPIKCAGN